MDEFITILLEQIRCKRARDGIAKEIMDHIEDATQGLEQNGMSHEKALAAAVEGMGDPVEIGVELDRIHRPRMDWRTFILIAALSLGGLLVQYAVTGVFGTQCLYTMIGLAVMSGICFLDYSFLGRYARGCYWGLTVVFFLLYFGASAGIINSTAYWVNGSLHGFAILTMLYVPVYAGILYTCRGTKLKGLMKTVLYMLLPLFFSLQGSITASLCIWVVFYGMILHALWKGWFGLNRRVAIPVCFFVAFVLPVIVAVLFFFFGAAGYQRMRIAAFLNPDSDAYGAGYFYNVIRSVISDCRWFGSSGEEEPVQNFYAFGREWIMTQLVVSYGLVCGFLVIAALGTLIVKVFGIAMKAGNQLGSMIGFGCGMLLLTECGLGVGMNFGLVPSTTVCMPFLTYGISNSLVYSVLFGFLLSICRYRSVLTEHSIMHNSGKVMAK